MWKEPWKRWGKTGKSSEKACVGGTVVQEEELWPGTSAI